MKDSDVFHHGEGRKHQYDFSVDVRKLVDAIRSRGNPFLQAGVDLVNLDGRISNANDVSAICNNGKDQYDQFVNDVIVTRNTPLDTSIKNNAFQLFKITKRRKALQPKVPLLKASISLFGQLYIATTERRGDNIVIWIRSSHTKPTRSRLCWRMEMRRCRPYHSTKSHIIHCIEKEAECCIAWCNGNIHPAAALLRGSRRRPTYSLVGCSRNGNFRAVHAEIILEASSGGVAKSVTA